MTHEEVKKQIAKEKEEHPIIYKLKRFYYWILRQPGHYRDVKWFFQRLFRGYADCDLWDLKQFIVRRTRRPLKKFVKNIEESGCGFPASLWREDDKNNDEGFKEWIEILKKIELAFDLSHEEDECTDEWFEKSVEEQIKDHEKIEEGFKLFGKYLRALWD